jgi:hypothetical protein
MLALTVSHLTLCYYWGYQQAKQNTRGHGLRQVLAEQGKSGINHFCYCC